MSRPPMAPGAEDTKIEEIRWNLALANRILSKRQVVDAFGHVSQRAPLGESFYISRSKAPATVMPADIVELDFAGEPVRPGAPASYLERFIHSEIYRARPDVVAVVHSHSPSVLPFSMVRGVTLGCVCHTAGFIGENTPVFEIRDVAGDATDLLVSDARLGAALARTLGERSLVLMRGHGSTVVGRNLPEVIYNAVYAEVNARVLSEGAAARLRHLPFRRRGQGRLLHRGRRCPGLGTVGRRGRGRSRPAAPTRPAGRAMSVPVAVAYPGVLAETAAPAGGNATIDLERLLDDRPISAFQIRVFVLCGLVGILDGLNTMSIGVAAKAMAAAFHIRLASFGPVFSAMLLGATVGAVIFGALGDRFGRKQPIIVAVVIIAVFTLLTPARAFDRRPGADPLPARRRPRRRHAGLSGARLGICPGAAAAAPGGGALARLSPWAAPSAPS